MSIKKVMVVGSGQMGAGIAQVFAKSGLEVYLNDISEEIVMSNLGKIDKQLEGQVKKERLTPEEKQTIMARIQPSTTYESAKEVDLVVEAATERKDIKLSIFKQLDEVASE
ncbi:3-hydroxyacyl-CoA dehydrogenase NAD-binding domain-containing protein, partial [Salmonella enterica subsp. enterica serovar Anatum]|nr:3-hydroxyacyl-CoA dehydrogenase NAD-binding domain-containing protein [Salmonella enterica subsp. enterica serovar Anatum]